MKKRFDMKKRKGFTLIELVMVVAVLGVLSSIAMVKYTDVSQNSKESSDYISAGNIATAAKLAISEGKTISDVASLVKEGYLEVEPTPQSVENGVFEISKSAKGVITVKVGGDYFYPRNFEENNSLNY
ncbi:MAG: type II secretion system protein [Paraclostridium sp.]